MERRAIPVAVAGLALLSAVAAVLLSDTVFPHLSVDNDEPIYRLHADALAHGELFVPAPPIPDAYRPWLAAIRGDHYVLKYSFLYPALLAASEVVSGGSWLALGLVAGGVVTMTWLLALEILQDPKQALLAAALVALSPVVLVQSALLLSYMPTLLLLLTFAWGVLRGVSTGRHRVLVLAGLAWGLAFAMRPYDALLFGAPIVLWVTFRRSGPRPSVRAMLAFAAPTTVGVACLLAWNHASTGSPLRLPFAVLEPDDTLGFGVRRLYPTDTDHHFGLGEGLSGIVRHGLLLAWWVAGGAVLLVLAVAAVVRPSARGAARCLAVTAILLPLGYVAFWGPWNASVLWGGTRYVGPFYLLPVVVPLAVLGARGLVELLRMRRASGVAAGVAIVATAAGAMVVIVDDNRSITRYHQMVVDVVAGPGGSPKLVFAALPTPFLMHPVPVVANRWDLSGPVVYALARGDGDLDVARLHPGRALYHLDPQAREQPEEGLLSPRLEALVHMKEAARLELGLVARWAASADPVELVVVAGGRARAYPLDPAVGEVHGRLDVSPGGAEVAGREAAAEWREAGAPAGLVVRLRRLRASGRAVVIGEERVPFRTDGRTMEVLVGDGRVWRAGRPDAPALAVSSRPE